MKQALSIGSAAHEHDRRISDEFVRRRRRLQEFIRRRVPDDSDVEDILQEVFYELVESYRFLRPIEQIGAWLFRVARNRIADLFRRKRADPLSLRAGESAGDDESWDGAEAILADEAGVEEAYARSVLIGELDAALSELPEAQREVFIAHELEGRGFRELARETGVGVNTLLSRKHYAVLYLRRRLQAAYDQLDEL